MFNDDEWDDYQPGIYRLDTPTDQERAYRKARSELVGLRIRIRVAQRLLAEADTIEKILYWTIKIAEWQSELPQ